MKKIVFIVLFIACSFCKDVICQSQTKLDFYLASKKNECILKKNTSSSLLPVLIKGNISEIQKLVQGCHGIFKYSYGNIAAIAIPENAIVTFESSNAVSRMEGKPPRMRTMDDTANKRNFVVEVQEGMSPLTQKYDGKGTVLGFVDSGIDFKHPDFSDSAGGTRVQYLWDMNMDTGFLSDIPQPYNYGRAWRKGQLDSGKGSDASSALISGHGSNVAGAAASNGSCNGQNKGDCPQADIIMVAYNFANSTPTMITDGINYIFTAASYVLHEPCVVNLSLGDYGGSHDGLDLQSLMIDSMISAVPYGRGVVAASGDAGNLKFHLQGTLTKGDTSFSWFTYDKNQNIVYISLWADTSDFSFAHFSIGVDKTAAGDYVYRAHTPFSSIKPYLGKMINTSLNNSNGQPLGAILGYGQLIGGVYNLEFQITPDSTTYYWRFIATDTSTRTGSYDIWAYDESIFNGVDTTGLDISPAQFPSIRQYIEPDTLETICTSFQCSDEVITVGCYNNRFTWKDCNSKIDSFGGVNLTQHLWAKSSVGPSRTRLLKPDICASGGGALSVYPDTFRTACPPSPNPYDSLECDNMDGGTSMSSPMVAGIAALYIEKYPKASWNEVKYAITQCGAYTDIYTGTTPNDQWGWGKVDAFKALVNCPVGINDITYSPPAILTVFPDPYRESAQINYDFSSITKYSDAYISLYDIMGNEIRKIVLVENKGAINISKGNLSSGIYFYSLIVDGNRLVTQKMEVM